MRWPVFFNFFVAFLFLFSAMATSADLNDRVNAKEILKEIDDMWRGSSSHVIFSMKVKTAHYSRNLRMEGWSKGKEKTLMRILSPKKEKGSSTLKSGNNIFTYLPKTDRTIKLTSGMMMGSWMGSHFTNDDLVKESRMEEDYDAVVSFQGEKDGKDIIEFNLIPKPDAPVVWGKVALTIMADSHMPIRQFYYDEGMELVRTMVFTGTKILGGRKLPAVMRVLPKDKPGEFTEIVYEEMEFDIGIEDVFFSLATLKRK